MPTKKGRWPFFSACVKWISVDAAEYINVTGRLRYKVGLCTLGSGKVYECPRWATTQWIAEQYGAWVLFRYAAHHNYPQLAMFQGDIQAIEGTINLRSRTRCWKQQRVLRAFVHHLRTS